MKIINTNPITSCEDGDAVWFWDEGTNKLVSGYICETCPDVTTRTGVHVSTEPEDSHGILTPIGMLFPTLRGAIEATERNDTAISRYLEEIVTVEDLIVFALNHIVADGVDADTDETAREAFKLKATELLGINFD